MFFVCVVGETEGREGKGNRGETDRLIKDRYGDSDGID